MISLNEEFLYINSEKKLNFIGNMNNEFFFTKDDLIESNIIFLKIIYLVINIMKIFLIYIIY